MRKISLQWRLTILTTVLITVLCGCLTFFLYKNGVYYIDTLQETVTDQGTTPEDAVFQPFGGFDDGDDNVAAFQNFRIRIHLLLGHLGIAKRHLAQYGVRKAFILLDAQE